MRGYVIGDQILVRADHQAFTADQIARHEVGHDMIAKGEVNINKVRNQIKQVLQTDEGINEAAKHYEEAYSGTGLTADEIWEEMICDSLGDMNVFSRSVSRAEAAEIMRTAIPAIQQAVSESNASTDASTDASTVASTDGNRQTRGAPTPKAVYNKRDGKGGWGKVYSTAQEALNDATKSVDSKLWDAFEKEFNSGKSFTPITNAIIAVQQDVRQDTITPIQGAKLLSEVYQKGGAKALDSLYIHETGNLYPKALERAKQYSTSADEVTEGKASRETLNEGEQYEKDNQDSRVLANGQETSAVGRSENNQRKQGNDTSDSSRLVAQDGTVRAGSVRESGQQRKTATWMSGRRFVSQASWLRFKEALLRNRTGLSSNDVKGRTVPSNILQKFEKTIFTDESGKLLTLYHWTPNKFLVFAHGDIGFHFGGTFAAAYDRRESKTAAKRGADIVKEVYLNIESPIVLQDDAGFWDAYEITSQLVDKGLISSKERAKISRMEGYVEGDYDSQANKYLRNLLDKLGYDGIIYENAVEDKGALSVIALYSDQIYTVSEETVGSNDGKASRELDLDYMDAVNRGDMETAQRMVDEAAKSSGAMTNENGLPTRFYHGSESDFNEFSYGKIGEATGVGILGDGFYFTDNKSTAKAYGKNVRSFYLQISNPYTASENDLYLLKTQRLIDTGYDGVVMETPKGKIVMAFDNNQIKSADPVTYDDNGNVIPLSERFNPENSDIRFSRELDLDYDESIEASETLTNRELLAGALESAARTEDERNKLQQYKEKILFVEVFAKLFSKSDHLSVKKLF